MGLSVERESGTYLDRRGEKLKFNIARSARLAVYPPTEVEEEGMAMDV